MPNQTSRKLRLNEKLVCDQAIISTDETYCVASVDCDPCGRGGRDYYYVNALLAHENLVKALETIVYAAGVNSPNDDSWHYISDTIEDAAILLRAVKDSSRPFSPPPSPSAEPSA